MNFYDANMNTAVHAVCEFGTQRPGAWTGQLDDLPEDTGKEPSLLGSEILRRAFYSRVHELAREASVDGWDGPGSNALRADAHARAAWIATLLPIEMLARADVSVTPSGSLSLDWDISSKNQLSVMLASSDTVSYAAYRPEGRSHGSFHIQGSRLPEEIVLAVQHWRDAAAAR